MHLDEAGLDDFLAKARALGQLSSSSAGGTLPCHVRDLSPAESSKLKMIVVAAHGGNDDAFGDPRVHGIPELFGTGLSDTPRLLGYRYRGIERSSIAP